MNRPAPQFDILGIGTIAVDDFLYVEGYPHADGKAEIRRRARSLGGQAATALAAASRLGARCAYVGALGSDDLSASVRTGLVEAGIDTCFVIDNPAASSIHSVIVVDTIAKTRAIFFDRSRLLPVPPEAITGAMIAEARVLLLDQLGPDTMVAAALLARDHGVPTVMDFEWPSARRVRAMMDLAGHLLMPYDFAADFTGLTDPHAIIAALHDERPCTAVTCGREGCYYSSTETRGEVAHLPAIPVETLETTGCGDVFHGAYATALARGWRIPRCLEFASAAAAAYASRPTGWQHLATLTEVEQLSSKL